MFFLMTIAMILIILEPVFLGASGEIAILLSSKYPLWLNAGATGSVHKATAYHTFLNSAPKAIRFLEYGFVIIGSLECHNLFFYIFNHNKNF